MAKKKSMGPLGGGGGLRSTPTTLAEANKTLSGGNGKKLLHNSPAFKKTKKGPDRIGAGKLYRGMKSPV